MKNIQNVSKNIIKNLNFVKMIYAALFSLMLIFSKHLVLDPYVDRCYVDNTYITDLSIVDLGIFILFSILIYLIMTGIHMPDKNRFYDEPRKGGCFIQFAISFVVIALCYIPYIFSYWPGGIYSDTMGSIWIALGIDPMTSHEPMGYTLLWKLMFKIAGGSLEPGDYGAMYMFTIVQSLAMVTLLSAFLNWNYRRGLKKSVTAIFTIIFAVFPLFPYYGISLWKDSVFGMVIFIYSWFLLVMTNDIRKYGKLSVKDIILYCVLSFMVVFFRNNGIYVVILVSILELLIYIKHKQIRLKMLLASLGVIVISLIIQHPIFNALGYNVDTAIESLAIPIQQTAYIYTTCGYVDDKDLEFLNDIMPLDKWGETYGPTVSDYIKFGEFFNRNYFNENVSEFMKVYIRCCLKNPVKAVKGYLLATVGYWDIFQSTDTAYICCNSIAWTGIFQEDHFAYNTGISFDELVRPKKYISSAIWVWIMLTILAIIIGEKKITNVIPILPAFSVWFTIMLAAPLAFSFRYVFAVFLCMPIYLTCLANNEDISIESTEIFDGEYEADSEENDIIEENQIAEES